VTDRSATLTADETPVEAFDGPPAPYTPADPGPSLSGPPAAAERPPRRKVAIVGFTPTREEAWPLLDDPEWDVWGMNNLHLQPGVPPASKFDLWWDLHPVDMIAADTPHAAWLAAGADGVPVLVWNARPEWPTAQTFHREVITDRFGRYFTNSVSWMVAAALLQIMSQSPDGVRAPEGATIAVYGVDMATTTEYAAQRPSCEYHLGIAAGAGVQIILPGTSDLLKAAALYGEEDTAFRRKLDQRAAELEAQLNHHQQQVDQHVAAVHQCRGALDTLNYIRGVWVQPVIDRNAPQNAVASDGQNPGAPDV
jgi:hypothetical protein